MLPLAGGQQPTVRRDDVDRHEGIDGQAVLAHEPADPAAEGQAADADAARIAEGGGQTMGRRGSSVVAGGQAGLRPGELSLGIDVQAAHGAQVEDDAAVDGAVAGQAVRAAADGEVKVRLAGEQDGAGHVGDGGRPDDHRREPVDRRVLDLAGDVIGLVTRDDDGAGDAGGEGGDVGVPRRGRRGEVSECHAESSFRVWVRWGALR